MKPRSWFIAVFLAMISTLAATVSAASADHEDSRPNRAVSPAELLREPKVQLLGNNDTNDYAHRPSPRMFRPDARPEKARFPIDD